MQINETVHGCPVGRRCASPDRQVGDPGSPSQIRTTPGQPPLVAAAGRAMNALEELLSGLGEVCAGLEDKRLGPGYRYTMTDIGLAAFSVFFLQSPSFLGHQRALAEGHGRSNCQTLLGMA